MGLMIQKACSYTLLKVMCYDYFQQNWKRIPTWDYIIEENLEEDILAEKCLSE